MKRIAFWLSALAVLLGCGSYGSPSMSTVNGTEVRLSVKPAKPVAGKNSFKVFLKDAQGPVRDAKVTVEYFMPAMGTMPVMQSATPAVPIGNGEYVSTMDLPMEGDWTMTVRTTLPAQGEKAARFHIRTGSRAVTPER